MPKKIFFKMLMILAAALGLIPNNDPLVHNTVLAVYALLQMLYKSHSKEPSELQFNMT